MCADRAIRVDMIRIIRIRGSDRNSLSMCVRTRRTFGVCTVVVVCVSTFVGGIVSMLSIGRRSRLSMRIAKLAVLCVLVVITTSVLAVLFICQQVQLCDVS